MNTTEPMALALRPKGTRKGPGNHIPEEMWRRALAKLAEQRVVSPAELDAELAKLAFEVDPDDKTGTGRNRRKNLVDHVKAALTKARLTMRLRIGRAEYYVWWPKCGAVKDTILMDFNEVRQSLLAVLKKANEAE